MEDNKLIEYPMEQFIDDFRKILYDNPDDYSVCFSQSFTDNSYFDIYINVDNSFIYDDRIELQSEGVNAFSEIVLFFKDFKVIRQDGNLGRSYYILFDKNKNDVTDYDLVINVTHMDGWFNEILNEIDS